MTMMLLSDSSNSSTGSSSGCEICGWMAAACSALAFGTFAVPIKSDIARAVNIDPLVFQSYKTTMCFVTAWFILFAPNHHTFVFTPWGIVSGLFWVPSGIATIYAVKTIGLALGIGIASSLIVLVSFVWGIFIFQEPIHSQFGACIAILWMILGLFGMSYYSTPTTTSTPATISTSVVHSSSNSLTTAAKYEVVGTAIDDDNDEQQDALQFRESYSDNILTTDMEKSIQHMSHRSTSNPQLERAQYDDNDTSVTTATTIQVRRVPMNEDLPPQQQQHETVLHDHEMITHVHVFGQYKVSKRYLGMSSAAFCGLYGGSVMAPMKYSTANTKGTHYLLSFAIGAAIVNIALWIFRYLYNVIQYQSWTDAYVQLPSFHIRKMWLVGGTSGTIWSIGNFFSLISVFYLGEGVGYPLVQTSILISGLWGLFYFHEIQGTERITKWLLSSIMTVCGILLLSFEHHAK